MKNSQFQIIKKGLLERSIGVNNLEFQMIKNKFVGKVFRS